MSGEEEEEEGGGEEEAHSRFILGVFRTVIKIEPNGISTRSKREPLLRPEIYA